MKVNSTGDSGGKQSHMKDPESEETDMPEGDESSCEIPHFSDYSRMDSPSENDDLKTVQCIEDAPQTCSECGAHTEVSDSHGEVYCPDCGNIFSAGELDFGPDWRGDEEEDKVNRGGSPLTEMMHDRGLSTVFNPYENDVNGNSIPTHKRKQLRRLNKWNERYTVRDNRDRNLKRALGEIQRMGSALGISENVRETASTIYRRIVDEQILIGQSIESMATSSLYIAARLHGNPRPFDDFYSVSQVPSNKVDTAYRTTIRHLDIELLPARPEKYLNQIFSKLDDKIEDRQNVEELAKKMLEQAREENLINGKNPIACSAGAVYASCLLHKENITQSMVSDAAQLSNVTIRNRYHTFIVVVGEKIDY